MPVSRWITDWIWEKAFGSKGETIIVLDEDRDGMLVGYGTWTHVEQIGSVVQPRHIEIAWFGVHADYQGVRYEESRDDEAGGASEQKSEPVADDDLLPAPGEVAYTVADVVYAEVERFASEHRDSAPDMPITLTCHISNERALRFYQKTGFQIIPDPKLQIENEIYYRLVR